MSEEEIAALVKAAGLEDLAAKHPADVREALATLAKHRAALRRTSDPALEPTPAYQGPAA
jgi:hypothetical protein